MRLKEGMEEEYKKYVENNDDSYGKGIIDYAERWAAAMEAELDKGHAIKDVAKNTSLNADTDGITGFMYGCAVSSLAHFWVHGEELRQWHNLDTQIGHEGEKANKEGTTLNPAILNVG